MREAEKRRHSKSSAPAPSSGQLDSDESPKAAKRDGKPATERQISAAHNPEVSIDPSDSRGRKRRLQDPLPLEDDPRRGQARYSSHLQQLQPPSGIISEKDAIPVAPVNPTYVPRSGYYFQHDDRTGPPPGRGNKRRDFERDGRTEPRSKPRYDDKPRDDYRGRRNDRQVELPQLGLRSKAADDTWSHDKFLERQAEDLERKRQPPVPPERPRRAGRREFRETPPLKTETIDDVKTLEAEKRAEKRYSDSNEKRIERGVADAGLPLTERDRYGERAPELERGRWMDSDSWRGRGNPRRSFNRYNGDGFQAGGRFDGGRRILGETVAAADRWNHDMFEELNRTPLMKQEEESIAQIEALLAT